ncbi:hypothetical protein ACWXWK_23445 [Pantoea ananatis]
MADICQSIIDSVLVFLLTVFLTGGISMTMSLVKKKNPRGALIRELTDEEESAVHDAAARPSCWVLKPEGEPDRAAFFS